MSAVNSVFKLLRRSFYLVGFLGLAGVLVYIMLNYYSWLFADTFEGQLLAVEKVGQVQVAVINQGMPSDALFSYSVKLLTKDKNGKEKVVTGSAVDRQWAVARPGECVKARFEPYPPWNLDKAGTYFNARLKEFIRPCGPEFPPLPSQPDSGVATESATVEKQQPIGNK